MLFSVSLLVACETVPVTGRSQLLLISPGQEMELGFNEFQKLKKETPISKDKSLTEMVNRIGQRIAAVAKLPGARWEFVLFDQPDVANAFCLPGGKVGIYSGILSITQNEAGLATVMAHEIAHAVARHGAERMSEGMLIELGGQVVNILASEKSAETQSLINTSYGIGSQLGIMLPHSRKQELEADHIGLLYMARAGYPPDEAIAFWQRFSQYNGKDGSSRLTEFFSTHPVDSTRIKELSKLLPIAREEYRKAIN
ncbi:MAG TPA: M48 family metallopeptidase [Gammaproteobacteria bacterium]